MQKKRSAAEAEPINIYIHIYILHVGAPPAEDYDSPTEGPEVQLLLGRFPFPKPRCVPPSKLNERKSGVGSGRL